MIIETVTGNSLEQELQNCIFGPLRLSNTHLAKDDFNPNRWANSTSLRSAEYSSAWADGAVVSTSRDIAKWSHRLYSGNFLNSKSMQSMFDLETREIGSGWLNYVGLGVWKLRVEHELAWGHGGLLPPFLSRSLYLPKFELGVAYASSGEYVTKQAVPGDLLVRAYIDNRPDSIAMCFDS